MLQFPMNIVEELGINNVTQQLSANCWSDALDCRTCRRVSATMSCLPSRSILQSRAPAAAIQNLQHLNNHHCTLSLRVAHPCLTLTGLPPQGAEAGAELPAAVATTRRRTSSISLQHQQESSLAFAQTPVIVSRV